MRGKKVKTQESAKGSKRRAGGGAGGGGKAKGAKVAGKIKMAPGGNGEGGARRGFPVFESIGQAAAVLGAPLAMIKAAKRKGCKAFISGSRVDAGLLIPFLFGMMATGNELPEGMASAAEWLTTEKAKREAIKRRDDEKSAMPVAEACRQAAEACAFFFAELKRGERELPPALAGLPAVEIFKRLHNFTETLRKAGKQKFEVGPAKAGTPNL